MRSWLLILTLAVASPAAAKPQSAPEPWPAPKNPIGAYAIGLSAVVGSLIYAPVKLVWGALSLTVLGPVNLGIQAISVDLPKPVIRCFVGGDYVVTTDHL